MDSKVVNAGIKKLIWPRLRVEGFELFSPRTAWRHHADRIDVLNFQSFNAYNAGVIGCTTYSFAVNLGCYLLAIPPHFEPSRLKRKKDLRVPHEYECHMRGRLSPGIRQPELRSSSIWFIDESGENLEPSLLDVRHAVESTATGWFEQFQSPAEVLRVFRDSSEDMNRLFGFGGNPSPVRHYFSGYVALSLNDPSAKHHLEEALASGRFSSVQARLADDVRRAIALSGRSEVAGDADP